ncbi:hypothetical protein [Vibrio owensii]|uniref:hypothetical protein n=1 Tax=Vibrio owensii TaxID=696485 RepID=UPI0018F12193|nr:hypothetical protein [Vibrio owensii]
MVAKYSITFDYELFGSGKGDVFKHLIEPTESILNVLESQSVKATFFVEQLEVEALIERGKQSKKGSRYHREAKALEAQLLKIVKSGHDIQLHLHPQWYRAKQVGSSWQLNFNWWRFSALPYESADDSMPGKKNLLLHGKSYLESLLKPIYPNYECIAFRAGGYNLGFEDSTFRALSECGFTVESSLCPGYYSNSKLSQYNYTNYSSYARSELFEGLFEFPLLTRRSTLFEKLSLARVYATLNNRKHKKVDVRTIQQSTSHIGDINSANLKNANFDICLSSHREVRSFIEVSKENGLGYTVLIGHPKDYSIFSPMKRVIKEVKNQGGCFVTLSELANV